MHLQEHVGSLCLAHAHASCCFQTINASSDKIRVRDLQMVTR